MTVLKARMRSDIKTWLKWQGFVGEGPRGHRKPMRECRGYVVRRGRRFRIRGDVVDIGEPIKTFDRWANSIERTIGLDDFIAEFTK